MTYTPTTIQIRFSDVDAMGHVNNAVYLSYFEYARMDFFTQLLGKEWDWQSKGIILLKNTVEYKQPLLLQHRAKVDVGVTSLGNKSFTLSYSLRVDDQVFCVGESILVAYDYSVKKSVPIHPEMMDALKRFKAEQFLRSE